MYLVKFDLSFVLCCICISDKFDLRLKDDVLKFSVV